MNRSVTKRLLILLLCLLLALTCACGRQSLTSSDLTSAASEETASETTVSKTEAATKASAKTSEKTSETSASASSDAGSQQDHTGYTEASGDSANNYPQNDTAAYVPEETAAWTTAPETKPAETTAATVPATTQAPETAAPTTTEPTATPVPVYSVYITVDGGGDAGVFFAGSVDFTGSASVYDILCKTGVDISGSSYYVSAINGLAEKQHGPMSGWLYDVNGTTPMISCGGYFVEDGDNIYWHYQYDE